MHKQVRQALAVALFLILFATLLGCTRQPDTTRRQGRDAGSAMAPTPAAEPARSTAAIAFDTAEFIAGTLPGAFPRDPALEPRAFAAKLGPFRIDPWPYPNRPGVPAAAHDWDTAGRLCSERGGRLCTELEWERACGGERNAAFSTGPTWACPNAEACSSPEGVFAMGAQLEWTASSLGHPTPLAGTPVVRGAGPDGPAASHRCAHRAGASAGSKAAFRCCYGAPNGARVPESHEEEPFILTEMKSEELRKVLANHPLTEPLSKDGEGFPAESAATVLERGGGDDKGFLFTTQPLLWRPVAGTEFLVLAARSPTHGSVVAVYHTRPDHTFSLVSSFVMRDEEGPLAFAYSPSIRPRLHFSTCWGCPGETGKILYRPPDEAAIMQP